MAIRNRKKVAVQANFLFSGSQQLWSSAGEGRGGAGCVPAPWNGVDAAPWGGAGSWYGLEQGAVEAFFGFAARMGKLQKVSKTS